MGMDLDLLKKELEEAIRSTEIGFWVPKLGENKIRILPPSPRETNKLFYKKVNVHYGVEGLGMVFCLSNWSEKCPVCEFIENLSRLGSVEAVNIAKRITANERFMMNIISLDDVETFGMMTIRQWLAPKTVRMGLLKIMLDKDWGDITDLQTGREVIIDKSERPGKKFVEYSIRPKPDRKKINVNPSDIPSFSEVLEKNKVSYNEMKAKMFGENEGDNEIEAYFMKMQERENKSSAPESVFESKKQDEDEVPLDREVKQVDKAVEKDELMKKAMEMLAGVLGKE